MGTAHVQGSLWGARARDFSEILEGFAKALYEVVFDVAGIAVGTRLLDVGCGPGLAAELAAKRGARVAGLDAAEASLEIARERTPQGDFRVGEMENLPWPDNAFDVVTSFNAFQYAADVMNALWEARRVARPGGRVAMAVLGRQEDCEIVTIAAALSKLQPLPLPGALRRVETLLEQAGLAPLQSGQVDCSLEFPDLATAVRGHMSSGPAAAVIRQVGAEPLQRAIAESLAPFRTSEGGYRLCNRYRYVIAAV